MENEEVDGGEDRGEDYEEWYYMGGKSIAIGSSSARDNKSSTEGESKKSAAFPVTLAHLHPPPVFLLRV